MIIESHRMTYCYENSKVFRLLRNRNQLKNPDIFGALYTLRIQYKHTQTQCEDGARDVRVPKLTPVTYSKFLLSQL